MVIATDLTQECLQGYVTAHFVYKQGSHSRAAMDIGRWLHASKLAEPTLCRATKGGAYRVELADRTVMAVQVRYNANHLPTVVRI